MKKIGIFLLSITLIFVLYACGETTTTGIMRGYIKGIEAEDGYSYNYYVPTTYMPEEAMPLFVVLHGGTQTAASIAKLSRMNILAEEYGFMVLYPQQSTEFNSSRYWNWFLAANQHRDEGEPKVIADMIQEMTARYQIDDERIFAAGFSAGACMALIMAITYPDLISGVAMAAGVGFAAAKSSIEAYIVMTGSLPAVETAIITAYEAMPEEFRKPIKALIFHGLADERVDIANIDFIVSQIAGLNDLIDDGIDNDSMTNTPISTKDMETYSGVDYVTKSYHDMNQKVVLKTFTINGMEHQWSGGAIVGDFGFTNGPDMSLILYQFFIGNEQ